MDVQMPEMDGLEATRTLRRREQGTGRRLPVLALTAYAMKGDKERCLEAGMDGYQSKPNEEKELRRTVQSVLATSALAGAEEADGTGRGRPTPRRALLDRVGGNEAVFQEIVGLFLEEYPRLLRAVRAAFAGGDAAGLAQGVHSLKGMLGGLAAPDAATAAQLENAVRQGDMTGAAEMIELLEAKVEALREELVKGRREIPAGSA
jgi:HPt (histidine-containing phosphotransfer) domain-containing protein